MENQRRLIRLNAGDFLEVRSLNEVGKVYRANSQNFTVMGICFSSEVGWQKGQVLLIDYFMPDELDSVKLKMVVVWSELIDEQNGYFAGGEIIDVEESKKDEFSAYYYRKLKEII